MTNKPFTRTNKLCLAGSAAVLIAFLGFISWTDHHFKTSPPTPQELREKVRTDRLEQKRTQHYLDHIKPHLPTAP